MRCFRAQQNRDAMDRDKVLTIKQRIVDQHIGMLGSRSSSLKVQMYDFLQWLPKAKNQVGRCCNCG